MYIVYRHTCTITLKEYHGRAGVRKYDKITRITDVPGFLLSRRWNEHVRAAQDDPVRLAKNWPFLHAIHKHGTSAWVHEIVDVCDSWEQAGDRETHHIGTRRSKAPHGYNLADGGGGVKGATWRLTTEQRARHSETQAEVQNRPDVKAKIKLSADKPEVKAQKKQSLTRYWAQPGSRQRQSATQREAQNRPEVKARKRAKANERWSQPGVRHAQSVKLRATWARPGEKERRIAAMNAPQAVENIRRANADPVSRAKKSAAQQKSIAQVDLMTGAVIAVFKSVNEASRATGIFRANVGECAHGKRKQAGGFLWQFTDPKDMVRGTKR